jgi:hypothetical protein
MSTIDKILKTIVKWRLEGGTLSPLRSRNSNSSAQIQSKGDLTNSVKSIRYLARDINDDCQNIPIFLTSMRMARIGATSGKNYDI